MNSLRIKNLRSLKDTGEIEIKPLTVVVGQNSSGKSSFLRFFPLIKQTLETRRSEPILWYSKDYVDFGSFRDALNKNSDDEIISFEITIPVEEILNEKTTTVKNGYFNELKEFFYCNKGNELNSNNVLDSIKIEVSINENYIEMINIKINKENIKIKFYKNTNQLEFIEINETEISYMYSYAYQEEYTVKDILPYISIYNDEIDENTLSLTSSLCEFFYNTLENYIKDSKNMRDILNILYNEDKKYKDLGKFYITPMILSKIIKNSEIIKKDKIIKDYILGTTLDRIMEISNKYISDLFANVKYIAPVRSSAERYYRIQGLAVNEIDSKGENIAMLLYNLSSYEKQEFSKWTRENFGFEVIIKSMGGHISIFIKDNDIEQNIVDTGFGYSQILPIVVQLWLININKFRYRYRRSISHILVIEQPELHLHPAMQSKLIKTLVKTITLSKKNGVDLRLIIETHSQSIINEIGYLISEKEYGFSEDLVNVLIFDKVNEYESKVKKASFDEDGYLNDWPIGFFSTRR